MSDPEKSNAELAYLIAMLRQIYTEKGVDLWLADAERKGLPIDEQIRRVQGLLDGAFS